MASKTSGGFMETVKTLVYAVVIALFIRTFFYEPFSIPSASMVPTLLVGDYLFVSKFSYGYSRYSLPLGLPLIPGRVLFTPPKRGDVVVFKQPRDPSVDFIKRVIGLPGDTVQMKDGRLYINDVEVPREKIEPYIYTDNEYSDNERTGTYAHYIETLPNGVRHPIIEISDDGPLDNTKPFPVPPGHYFMMGDNRDNSADSRDPDSGVGYVPAENLVGRAQFIFFSSNGYAHWWEVWNWPSTIRYDRLFTAIR
jgi:signal peptidase I